MGPGQRKPWDDGDTKRAEPPPEWTGIHATAARRLGSPFPTVAEAILYRWAVERDTAVSAGEIDQVSGGVPLTSFAEEGAPHFPALSRTDRQSRFTATVGSSRSPAAQRHPAERSPPVAAAQEPSRPPRKIRWPDTSARRRRRSRGSRPLERTRCGPPRHDGSRAALAAHTC